MTGKGQNMVWPRWLLLLSLAGTPSACTGSFQFGGDIHECGYSTNELTITPSVFARDQVVDLIVDWRISHYDVDDSAATTGEAELTLGDEDDVVVTVPLAPLAEDRMGATFLNPFGPGAPEGPGQGMVRAPALGDCTGGPSASFTFTLQ